MKNFWSSALGACVGSIVGLVLFAIIIGAFVMAGIAGMSESFISGQQPSKIEKKSILRLTLEGTIPEKAASNDELMSMFYGVEQTPLLRDVIDAIYDAEDNDRIEGLFIDCRGAAAGLASSIEIRRAIEDFKANSGKWVYAYADTYTQSDYYIASVADSIFINPEGSLDLHGLSSAIPHFKTLLDKVGVEMQIFKVGTFKSAVEPFMLPHMSDANREQTMAYMGSIWSTLTEQISKSRGISVEQLNQLTDSITYTKPTDYLVKNKLVDATCYGFEIVRKLKELTDVDEDKPLRFVGMRQYASTLTNGSARERITVLYADGDIEAGTPDAIDATELTEAIITAAGDKDVKGLVMRVNSPGGSAFDSEQIWAALEDFKKTGKPYAVSMGNYAASGGYYISSGADRIFAEPTTLTGSIGIFGMVPNVEKLVADIGINIDEVGTNQNPNFPSITKAMTPMQAQQMQRMVEKGYDLFTRRCAQGRHVSQDSIKAIAEGRVWDGRTALKIGLVDELGDLSDAIAWVAEKAKLEDYSLEYQPKTTPDIKGFFTSYMTMQTRNAVMSEMPLFYQSSEIIRRMLGLYPVQARAFINVEL